MNLHKKAVNELFATVDFTSVTSVMLNETDKNGNTVWHIAAEHFNLKHVPIHLFNTDSLKVNKDGNTVFHLVYEGDFLKTVPREFLTKEILNSVNNRGRNVWTCALSRRSFEELPIELLDKDVCNNTKHLSLWYEAACSRELELLPKDFLTSETFNEEDSDKQTVLHKAAESRDLHNVPKQYLTIEALNKRNRVGSTVWHYASWGSSIKDIPKHIFSKEVLTQVSDDGKTVFHTAAEHNTLKDIPNSMFSSDILNMPDGNGKTVWNTIAAQSPGAGKIQDIPIEFITPELLALKLFNFADTTYINSTALNKTTCFSAFIANNPQFEKDLIARDSRFILSAISPDSIEFAFSNICDLSIVLSKDGVMTAVENVKTTHKTLHDAVLFIQDNFLNGVTDTFIPKSTTCIQSFSL